MIHADAEMVGPLRIPKLYIRHRHRVRAGLDRVLLIIHKGEPVHLLPVDGVEEGVDRAISLPGYLEDRVLVGERPFKGDMGNSCSIRTLTESVLDQPIRRINVDLP